MDLWTEWDWNGLTLVYVDVCQLSITYAKHPFFFFSSPKTLSLSPFSCMPCVLFHFRWEESQGLRLVSLTQNTLLWSGLRWKYWQTQIVNYNSTVCDTIIKICFTAKLSCVGIRGMMLFSFPVVNIRTLARKRCLSGQRHCSEKECNNINSEGPSTSTKSCQLWRPNWIIISYVHVSNIVYLHTINSMSAVLILYACNSHWDH